MLVPLRGQLQNTKLQSYKVTKLQSYKVTKRAHLAEPGGTAAALEGIHDVDDVPHLRDPVPRHLLLGLLCNFVAL